MKHLCAIIGCAVLLCCIPASAGASSLAFLASQADSFVITEAMKNMELPADVEVFLITPEELQTSEPAKAFVAKAGVIVVDVMIAELVDYLEDNVDISNKKVYALRASRDDKRLASLGIVFDKELSPYFDHMSVHNILHLIYRVVNRHLDDSVHFEPVQILPSLGIYHPKAKDVFTDINAYLSWYRQQACYHENGLWVGLTFYASNLSEGHVEPMRYTINKLMEAGYNVLPAFGWDPQVIGTYFLDGDNRARVDFVLAFSMKFASALNDAMNRSLKKLNVPIFNAVSLYYNTIPEWRHDARGLSTMEVAWAMANPEISGLIEPMALAGKEELLDVSSARKIFVHKPIEENVALFIQRLDRWAELKRLENSRKKVAIFVYNNTPGKQNVGASYLNVFNSLKVILEHMKAAGYQVNNDVPLSEKSIRELMLSQGRNIGNWAPGELQAMQESRAVATVPVETYCNWYAALPEAYRTELEAQWGNAKDADIMAVEGGFVIPRIDLGNVVILPEPSRGYADDAVKLYHSPTLYPHHQYTAAYLWVKQAFGANAVVHLGTHGTQEWLPGKQAGLSTACPPVVLGTDIPNLYPYIVDDIGEGIQAKRRSSAVAIDHLTPAVNKAGLYAEYRELYSLIGKYYGALSLGGATADQIFQQIQALALKQGLHTDIGAAAITKENLRTLENYLVEVGMTLMPHGMHTFGVSPAGQALTDTVESVKSFHPKANSADVRARLKASGPTEIARLLHGLDGGYIPSGVGNDPVRNPDAMPTGKNFYGFDPAKIPSKAAWELGKKAAQDIIDRHKKQKGGYPNKVAIVLWATETIRNEGVNESTALYLMGMKPKWDKAKKVVGTTVIPGKKLGRPRIDVLLNPSGLYRDIFPNMLNVMDTAVQQAASQQDIENFLAKNSAALKKHLSDQGLGDREADVLSKMRIFSEKPGNYGNRVSEVASASGLWDNDDDVAKVYEKHTGYGYGMGQWGVQAPDVFGQQLKGVDTAVHSISSSVYGTMDNDDMFQFVGGLSLAVEKRRGTAPDTLITLQRTEKELGVESLDKTIGRELRTRYFNPRWIEGMKQEQYAGAREMSNFVDYMWGWQVTTPGSVSQQAWEQTHQVYVQDKYDMGIKKFFNENNPWAYQSVTARMVEAIRKDYWDASEDVEKEIVKEYVDSVMEHGLSCSDNTCANPLMHQEVIDVAKTFMSPEKIEKLRSMLQNTTQKTLDQQLEDLKQLKQKVQKGFKEQELMGRLQDKIEGFKMEKMEEPSTKKETGNKDYTRDARLFSLALMALVALGLLGFFLRKR